MEAKPSDRKSYNRIELSRLRVKLEMLEFGFPQVRLERVIRLETLCNGAIPEHLSKQATKMPEVKWEILRSEIFWQQ